MAKKKLKTEKGKSRQECEGFCPVCGEKIVPTNDLRILCIWAENWTRKIGDGRLSSERCETDVVHFIARQILRQLGKEILS
jgi:hypothetical protein